MAETADDIPNDLIMAMFEIVEAEYDEQFDRDGVVYSLRLADLRRHV